MPEITVLGDFVIDPKYDAKKDVLYSMGQLRKELNKEIACINSIDDTTIQLICMFSLIDCMAQEWANYPVGDSKSTFCNFVLKHQSKCDYLDKVEPVTLYYRVEDLIEKTVQIPGFPPEKEISLEALCDFDMSPIEGIIKSNKAKELLDYIEDKKGIDFAKQKENEHKLISLIYRMRSKVTHEMTCLGQESRLKEYQLTEPYYRNIGRMYVLNKEIVTDDVYELVIPNAFILGILNDCIDGYLNECLEQCRVPFSNNQMTRKYRITWYDK